MLRVMLIFVLVIPSLTGCGHPSPEPFSIEVVSSLVRDEAKIKNAGNYQVLRFEEDKRLDSYRIILELDRVPSFPIKMRTRAAKGWQESDLLIRDLKIYGIEADFESGIASIGSGYVGKSYFIFRSLKDRRKVVVIIDLIDKEK